MTEAQIAQPEQRRGPSPLAEFNADMAKRQRLFLDLLDKDPKRLARFLAGAFQAVSKNPTLLEPQYRTSLLMSLGEIAALDLELSPIFQHVALVPRRGNDRTPPEVQIMPMYKGLIVLMVRSGAVEGVEPYVVRRGEFFRCSGGSNPGIVHEIPLETEVDESDEGIIAAYCMLKKPGSNERIAGPVVRRKQLDEAMARSTGKAWKTDFVAMCLKTAVRRAANYIPQSEEVAWALARDNDDSDDRPPPLSRIRQAEGHGHAIEQSDAGGLLGQLGAGTPA